LGDFGEAVGPGAGIPGCDGRGENVKMGKRGWTLFCSFLQIFSLFGVDFREKKKGGEGGGNDEIRRTNW
jgi:hypothetical protein